jgi:hypothetical protein
MEGLKYVYLNPEKSVELHIESLKEFQGGSVTNQKVIEYGQAVGTSLGMVPGFRDMGLGYMDPGLVKETRQTVETYMGVKNMPPAEKMFTNKFIGSAKLSKEEWATVEARAKKYSPSRS